MSDHDVLDNLLRHAQPRPVPEPDGTAVARAAVHEEWRTTVGRRKLRRRITQFALAATVVMGAFIALNQLRVTAVTPPTVATIARSVGPVYLLGESAELRPTDGLDVVTSGQTIVTGDDAGLALAWGNGGSVRIDEHTRVRFDDDETVFVEEGRVYFDSHSSLLAGITAGDSPAFSMRTSHGELHHLGTQYMADVARDALVVSVREGQVAVDGRFHQQTVVAGQQATWSGQQRPSILNIGRTGEAWDWVNRTTPAADVDGKTLHEFLTWVCREMGLELRFEGQAERIAHEAILKGRIDTQPAEALRLRLATAALEWRIEGDVIYIRNE